MKETRGKFFEELQCPLPDRLAPERQIRLFADEPAITSQMNEHQAELDVDQQRFVNRLRLVQYQRCRSGATVLLAHPANVVMDSPVGINALPDVIRQIEVQDINRRTLGQFSRRVPGDGFGLEDQDGPVTHFDVEKCIQHLRLRCKWLGWWKCGKNRLRSVRYRSLVTDTYSHHTLLIVCRYKVIETAMLWRMKNQPQSSARSRFAHAMKQFRQERGLSQEKLAEMTGLHRTYIGSVERGERNISVDNMEAIARAMALDIGCFFEPSSAASNADHL